MRATVTLEQLLEVDVILAYRMLYDDAPAVRKAVEHGTALVWDTDDDLGSMPKDSFTFKSLGARALRRVVAARARYARTADVVTTTNERLAGKCAEVGARRTTVIPNYLRPGSVMPVDRRDRENVVIGWIAAAEHKGETRRIPIVRALRQLLDERPHVRVETAGIRLPLPESRYRWFSWVMIDRIAPLFARWDIGIAPLSDIPFNRSRSDVKLKEYASSGLPWLASPIGPYADKTENEGGWLVPDDEWYDALVELVDEQEARLELGRFAARWAASQVVIEPENARRWEAACLRAIERNSLRTAT